MKRWAVIAGLCGIAIAIGLATRDGDPPVREVPPSAATEIPVVTPARVSNKPIVVVPNVDEVVELQAGTEVLLTGLLSDDAVVVAESANALVGRGAIAALPQLVTLDVSSRPRAAPSIIYAMGRLGALANEPERGEAVERLIAMMGEEKRRGAPESQGNLLQIYEALGHTRDARAIAPLERELGDATVTTAPKVTIVAALVELGARQSRPALERLRDSLEPAGVDFEAELRRDLIAAIREALVQLS
jgi:HEAT repeat protein